MSDIFTWPPDPYILFLLGAGLLIALVAWLPLALKKLPLSLPIVCIVIGAALFATGKMPVDALPWNHQKFVERLTVLLVLFSLNGERWTV